MNDFIKFLSKVLSQAFRGRRGLAIPDIILGQCKAYMPYIDGYHLKITPKKKGLIFFIVRQAINKIGDTVTL